MKIVTGAHRSGTSLLAQTVRALGADLGPADDFYAADRWNENGYLERRDVMDLNSRIVTGFPRSSGGLAAKVSKMAYLGMPSGRGLRARGARLSPAVSSLAKRLDGLVVKDPRFCLTLPEWLGTGRVDGVLVSLRDPLEVAMSLKTRQRVPIRLGLRFWEYHVRMLLDDLPDNGVLVDHARLVSDDPLPELRKIGEFVGASVDDKELVAALSDVFTPSLRHEISDGSMSLPASTQTLWEEARKACSRHGAQF